MSEGKETFQLRMLQVANTLNTLRMRVMKETDSRKLVTGAAVRGDGSGGEDRVRLVKESKLSVTRQVRSGDLMYNMVIIVDNTVLYN